jgi:hypothetical protein
MEKGESAMTNDTRFDRWLDAFFNHLFARRPIDATCAGLHSYNGVLPAVDSDGLETVVNEISQLLSDVELVDRDGLDRFRKIDRDLAEGFLKMQKWERDSGYMYTYNPVTYTGEAAFSLISLFLSDTRSVKDKQADFDSRLRGLPRFLADAKSQLQGSPKEWAERADKECAGTLAFLIDGLDVLQQDEGLRVDGQSRKAAIRAVEEFSGFLKHDLPEIAFEKIRCGTEVFKDILGWAHGIDRSFDLHAYMQHAEAIVADCSVILDANAGEFGAASPQEALALLADQHPDKEGYLKTYEELWEESRLLNERENLVTWSDYPIEYVPIPRWARKAQPYLYFLFYRCPPRWNRPDTYRYLVSPFPSEESDATQEAFLRANNTFVIKTNHVLHHGGIGHHVQNWNAVRSRSRVGQIAANDGPSRLTMLCGGTHCEGWACYISELAGSKGFLSPLESYAEISSQRRMAARAVVDIALHTGRFSLEDAISYYRDKAMMAPAAAYGEAVKNSLFPGSAIMYLYGVEKIKALRDTIAQKMGDQFSLRAFHDSFLSYGTIPAERIAAEMMGKR